MRYTIILLIVLTFPALCFSSTIVVPDDYPTIHDAIDAASGGDTVLVKPNTYVENIDFTGKAITVMSEQGADVTIIDGNQTGSVVTCQSNEDGNSVLDGFTIFNGSGTDVAGILKGGGMFNSNSSPTVTNCIFLGNTAFYGAGMCNDFSDPTVTGCSFSGNVTAVGFSIGGGMYNELSNPTVTHCTFSGNFGGIGGGMANLDSISQTVTHCTFSENWAVAKGGGMANFQSSLTVTHCTFLGNWTTSAGGTGGGMANGNSNPTVANCIFTGNQSQWYSGGMDNVQSNTTVTNCTFSGNTAVSGGGMGNLQSSPTLTNCILWNDSPDEIYYQGTSPVVNYSCVEGGWSGMSNIDLDPLFVDPVNGDFHLTYNSPCTVSGDNTAVQDLEDFEGDPRIAYGAVDMGADEFYTHLYWTGDATPGGNVELKFVGLPGTMPVGLILGTGVLTPSIPSMWGDWYLAFPIIGPIDLGSITSPDGVLILPGTIPASPPAPYSIPMQALIGAELTNLSVLEVK